MTHRRHLSVLLLLAACSPATRRPAFTPMPEARRGELELDVPAATDSLARALIAAGIPVSRIAARDGYLETPWFDTATGRPASGRPLGPGRVRVRGWVSPSRYRYSELVVETVFRPFADPSAAPRALEQSVAYAHPVRRRVRDALASIGARSAVDEPDALTLAERVERDNREKREKREKRDEAAAAAPVDVAAAEDSAAALAAKAGARPDTARARADSAPARIDTTRTRPDSIRAAPDTSRPTPARPAILVDTSRARPDSTPAPARRTPAPTIVAPAPAPATPVQPAAVYSVQVAASADQSVVDFAATRLRELGFTPRIVTEGGLMKVRTGRYATESAARAAQRRLRTTFPDAFLTRR
jgi:cell division septation protein DedD